MLHTFGSAPFYRGFSAQAEPFKAERNPVLVPPGKNRPHLRQTRSGMQYAGCGIFMF